MDSKNKKILLSLLALLLTIRFVVVPWLDWQDEQRTALYSLTQKLEKSKGIVLVKDQLTEGLAAAESSMEAFLTTFPQSEDSQTYRLALMQKFQAEFEPLQVNMDLFDWVTEEAVENTTLVRGTVSLTISGKPQQVALAQMLLEKNFQALVIRQLRSSGASQLSTESDIKLNLMINVFFRLEAQP